VSGAIIAAIIGGLFGGGGLVALGRLILDRRKGRADEAQIIAAAAAEYVGVVRDEIKDLRRRVAEQDRTVAAQTAENEDLRARVEHAELRVETVESKLAASQRAVRAYSRWSKRAYDELVLLGSQMEPPPSDELESEDS
jgi:hypothetical protein